MTFAVTVFKFLRGRDKNFCPKTEKFSANRYFHMHFDKDSYLLFKKYISIVMCQLPRNAMNAFREKKNLEKKI